MTGSYQDNLFEIKKRIDKFPDQNLYIVAQHPVELQVCFPEFKINSMQEYDLSYYKIMAEVALYLKRQNLNPNLVKSVTVALCDNQYDKNDNDISHLRCNKTISDCLKVRQDYIENIVKLSGSHTVLIIGTDHDLLYQFLSNGSVEVIFIGNDYTQCHTNIPYDRQILQHDPSTWHEAYDANCPPNGIEIIDCASQEEAACTIKKLLDSDEMQCVSTNDLQLLQRLEIIIPDFAYDKPVYLDPKVYLLGKMLDENFTASQSNKSSSKDGINTLQCHGLYSSNEFLSQHIAFYQDDSSDELNGVLKRFLGDFASIISNVGILSVQEYKEIFDLLSQNISYNENPYRSLQLVSPNNIHQRGAGNIIISSDKDISFDQLLYAKNVVIIHISGDEEPQWLLKLRVLLTPQSCSLPSISAECVTHMSEANPPQSARPKTLSATMFEMLMRDPYAFYVRYILKVKPTVIDSEAMDFGIFVHNAIAEYTKQGANNYDLLLSCGNEVLQSHNHRPQAESLWWSKFKVIAQHFVVEEARRLDQIARVECEVKYKLPIADHLITVTCDLVEHLKDGTVAIIEYKTGSVPTNKDIKLGQSPQLLLQGLAVQESLEQEVSELSYWQLKVDGIIKQSVSDVQEALKKTKEGVSKVLTEYPTLTFKPTAHYKDYQHSSRLREVFNL